ncbi:hypothetical protein SE17_40565, partial [Kouleothrix aurantiaca]
PAWQRDDPQLTAARYLVWIFALDDLSDDWSLPLPELLARYATFRAVAAGALPPPGDGEAALLHEIVAELSVLPLWPLLAETWRASLGDILDGMAAERDPSPRASLEAYMALAHLSIGAMQDAWTVLMLLGDDTVAGQIPEITAALRAEARVIRLSNDLNSADKELLEGKQNALTVLAAHGDGRALTEAALERAIPDFHAAMARVHTASGRFERCITTTAEATVAFYRKHTFHEYDHSAEPRTEN